MNVLNKMMNDVIVERIGWTLLHSVWQIAAIALVYGFVLLMVRRSADLRYLAGCAALVAMLAVPIATFFADSVTVDGSYDQASPAIVTARNEQDRQQTGKQITSVAQPRSQTPSANRGDSSDSQYRLPESGPRHTELAIAANILPPADGTISLETDVRTTWPVFAWLREAISLHAGPWIPEIVAVWMAGVLLLWMRLVFGICTIRRLRNTGVSSVPDSVRRVFDEMLARTQIRHHVSVMQSALVQVPSVLGLFRPVILLPVSAITGLTSQQFGMIFAHELAHVRRYDFVVNALQNVLEALLFYHPCVWWVSNSIRTERENCCDDYALSLCGDQVHYVKTLMAVEELGQATTQTLMAATGGSLVRRVRRIVGTDAASAQTPGAWIAGIALLLAFSVTLAYADGDDPAAEELASANALRNVADAAQPPAESSSKANADEPHSPEPASSEPDVTGPQYVHGDLLPIGHTITMWIGDNRQVEPDDAYLDIERALLIGRPKSLLNAADESQRSFDEAAWALRENIDVAGYFDGGLSGLGLRKARLDGDWEDFASFTATMAKKQFARQGGQVKTWGTSMNRHLRDVYAFRTVNGSLGLIQIIDFDKTRRRQQIRFRLLTREDTEGPRGVVAKWFGSARGRISIALSWELTTRSKSLQVIEAEQLAGQGQKWLSIERALNDPIQQFRVDRALGNDQIQLVVTNSAKDSSAKAQTFVFRVIRRNGRWLIDWLELHPSDVAETLLRDFALIPGVEWDPQESDEAVYRTDGLIRWIDESAGLVWLNLGSKHGLPVRTTFSVFAKSDQGVARRVEDIKGQIEVTRIIDTSTSEARILSNDSGDPIAKGDPVYTPRWHPGIKKYAIVGRMDVDQNGVLDRGQFHDLVKDAGAVIGHEVLDDGRRIRYTSFPDKYEEWEEGDSGLDADTRYLIIADIPDPTLPRDEDEKEARGAIVEHLKEMRDEARRLGIEELRLSDFFRHRSYRQRRQYIPGRVDRPFNLRKGSPALPAEALPADVKPDHPDSARLGEAL
jgi:beta-lactamase regulating signal transducer with metallopeptidase domain